MGYIFKHESMIIFLSLLIFKKIQQSISSLLMFPLDNYLKYKSQHDLISKISKDKKLNKIEAAKTLFNIASYVDSLSSVSRYIFTVIPTNILVSIAFLPILYANIYFKESIFICTSSFVYILSMFFSLQLMNAGIQHSLDKGTLIASLLEDSSTSSIICKETSVPSYKLNHVMNSLEKEQSSWWSYNMYRTAFNMMLDISFLCLIIYISVICNDKSRALVLIPVLNIYSDLLKSIKTTLATSSMLLPLVDICHQEDGKFENIKNTNKKSNIYLSIDKVVLPYINRGKPINMSIKEKDFVIVEGDNGSGKTTLCNILSGYEKCILGDINCKDSPRVMLINSQFACDTNDYEISNDSYTNICNKVKSTNSIHIQNLLSSIKNNKYPKSVSLINKILVLLEDKPNIVIIDEALDLLDINIVKDIIGIINKVTSVIFVVSHRKDIINLSKNKIKLTT